MADFFPLDLDTHKPTVQEAIGILERTIERKKSEKVKVLVIIHGYGSHGVGGALRQKLRPWLLAQKANGKLKKVIFGEEFDMFHFQNGSIEIKNACKGIEEYYGKNNMGVTIVEI